VAHTASACDQPRALSELPRPYVEDAFWAVVPACVSVPEDALRITTLALAALLPFGVDTPRQRRGVLVYLLGVCLYAGSYGAQILFPEASWSQSAIGFLAPVWTPLLWLVGIALMTSEPHSPRWFRSSHFVIVAAAFVAFYVAHAATLFVRLR
jgi:hypothetical protein